MGYVVLHLDKSPDNEVPMTAHIARTKMPPNAIPELTYLNEELVEYPDGVQDRTQAIQYRLETAGLTRKIGTNQVRVIRVMLTGTQEDCNPACSSTLNDCHIYLLDVRIFQSV